jgi:cytochrome c-type biogenesis protein CcmH/NrfG
MSTEPPKKPDSPFRLNTGRIVLLALGVLMLIYIIGAFSGSLTNYQMVKEGAQDQKDAQQAAPAEPAPTTPAPTPAN